MNDFFIDLGFTALLGLISRTIPNEPGQKKKWKKAFLKLFKGIASIYKDDPDFKL